MPIDDYVEKGSVRLSTLGRIAIYENPGIPPYAIWIKNRAGEMIGYMDDVGIIEVGPGYVRPANG
jgi:hypothetical protein